MVIRYQMGPYPAGPSWDALELSIRLMQRLEPDARIVVTHQGDLGQQLDGVEYHHQDIRGRPYCDGRHMPLRYDESGHEAWLDNDHIFWALPPGWVRWRERRDAVLIWRADWEYYGAYSDDIRALADGNASAGMWGLPPYVVMPMPVYRSTTDLNQDEYGFVVSWLARQPHQEYVWQHEVPVYCPDHNALKGKDKVGTHGVHLNGLNRGWNEKGVELLYKLRSIWL